VFQCGAHLLNGLSDHHREQSSVHCMSRLSAPSRQRPLASPRWPGYHERRPADTKAGPRRLAPPWPASWVSRELPHGCPTGLFARGTVFGGDRRKCVKVIDLLVPEEGIEPTLPLRRTGF
jgi:hypothetical protein